MKSFCIKTNSETQKDFLLEELEKMEVDKFYFSYYKFRIYKNIIVHYTGDNVVLFQKELSKVIANTIEKFFDKEILCKIVRKNYFYLSDEEEETINRISIRILEASKENDGCSEEILERLIYEYIDENKKMILEGFVNFRIKEYIEILDYVTELAVTSYLNLI